MILVFFAETKMPVQVLFDTERHLKSRICVSNGATEDTAYFDLNARPVP